MNVNFTDKDHVWIDGRQYISLRRFFEKVAEVASESKRLAEENEKLIAENEHYKALLKESL